MKKLQNPEHFPRMTITFDFLENSLHPLGTETSSETTSAHSSPPSPRPTWCRMPGLRGRRGPASAWAPACQLHAAGAWPRRKQAAPGAVSVSADSAEGWAGPRGGWHARARKARQDPHSLGILARAGGEIKWSNLSWLRSAGEYSNIYFCRAFGEAELAPQISRRRKFPGWNGGGSSILIASWPPVVRNGSDSGVVEAPKSFSPFQVLCSKHLKLLFHQKL